MENDICSYVKKYPICQLQKTTRINRQAEAIVPDTPVNPNDKMAMDIFEPLPCHEKWVRIHTQCTGTTD